MNKFLTQDTSVGSGVRGDREAAVRVDFPFATPADSIAGLRSVNLVAGNSGLPRVPEEVIQGILERDTFELLGLS